MVHRLPRLAGGIIPAYAGSTVTLGGSKAPIRDHPRIRGEHPLETPGFRDGMGSSPHTRGALLVRLSYGRLRRIIPAYAGSTHISQDPGVSSRDHPRIRGEHVLGEQARHEEKGSSPHTRGAR